MHLEFYLPMFNSRGSKSHQSSTTKEHTQTVSVSIYDKDDKKLGSVHIDKEGNVSMNKA
jgi:hypothetical protein